MRSSSDWALFENAADDEELLIFYEAAQQIQGRRQISLGAAQRTLRELCASGDVRSWLGWFDPATEKFNWMPPSPIKPKEWKDNDLDLEPETDKGLEIIVYVASNDLEYWFDPTAVTQPVWHSLELEDLAALSPEAKAAIDEALATRRELVKNHRELKALVKAKAEAEAKPATKPALGKRPRIKALLTEYFPEGVPDPAHCARKTLQSRLLKADPTLAPLDIDTLRAAIDEYNDEPKRTEPNRIRSVSD